MVKRIYDEPESGDGYRVLVDRLWPRGMSKERAALDLWMKDIAPSPGLRKWFGHDPARFDEFDEQYRAELDASAEVVGALRDIIMARGAVTLLYAATDPLLDNAVVRRDCMINVVGRTGA
ncbi:DUF488 domain-containing protein [Bifidobacterium sp. 82T10]|uniref:DUF488 domain-containing protein n=1 Tax=Bifidobacterium miconis TaxID=2834435 RepID=A0ABS6WFC3_9BIFI|nr:DUF488 domain-containing protein [Bifidobacterium miconis]MBW3092760.1 DUF488 domain-containing protein [Bifidobacterium miconis]